ncbi:MAG: solute-binding protein [Chloroflexi bacterium]|jgi:tungstate transport system substrate-binding protein|nr:solute-binding protein [Chloroflexota bacterium]
MSKRIIALLSALTLLITLFVGCAGPDPTQAPPAETEATEAPTEESETDETQKLILATTTSTENSGLLAYLLPAFEEAYNAEVEVIAVGTGQALEIGEKGDADVLMVHARSLEDAFMEAGHGVRREDLMYNDFVIVGPPDDPAGIEGMSKAPKAFAKIAEAEVIFISRGDDSGTHTKEKAIWTEAGVEPTGDWYVSAGQGMGAVLTMADEQQAYTLSDRATYLARTLEGTDLVILVEGDPILFNPYGVIAVNPDKNPDINAELANQFIDWLISVSAQEKISEFGTEKFGMPLFTPDSEPWREANQSGGGEAALQVTGNVNAQMAWDEETVRAMDTVESERENKSGEMSIYTGVPIKALLAEAGVADDATTVVFVAEDGYTAEADLAEVQACDDCIVSFRNQGGFSIVMPGYSGKLQVKGVVEIQVK